MKNLTIEQILELNEADLRDYVCNHPKAVKTAIKKAINIKTPPGLGAIIRRAKLGELTPDDHRSMIDALHREKQARIADEEMPTIKFSASLEEINSELEIEEITLDDLILLSDTEMEHLSFDRLVAIFKVNNTDKIHTPFDLREYQCLDESTLLEICEIFADEIAQAMMLEKSCR